MTVLPVTILAHGAYDALLDLPGLDDTGFLAMIVFIGFSYSTARLAGMDLLSTLNSSLALLHRQPSIEKQSEPPNANRTNAG
jgi:hypothetical protein